MLIYLHIVYRSFHITMVELSSCDTDYMDHNA